MKKLTFILLFFINAILVFSQNPNMVYSISQNAYSIALPQPRTLYGGTIINVTYAGTGFSKTAQGAFEYACKLVEEQLPTTFPLNIKVEFGRLSGNDVLAMVENNTADGSMCEMDNSVDKVYVKRYAQLWENYFSYTETEGLSFFRDTYDFSIKFSNSKSFDYNISPTDVNTNKYDFITVALQALIKGVGFTCKAYASDNKLYISTPANKYTYSILIGDSIQNYTKATSGNTTFSGYNSERRWLLECSPTYRQGISLNYLDASNSGECSIMRYGIPKGAYTRNIGTFLPDFFSFCGWDRPIVTGISNSYRVTSASTDDVIEFQGIVSSNINSANTICLSSTNEDFLSYMQGRIEIMDEGDYVLLKDGSWQRFTDLQSLSNNSLYARTADGYLRLKKIRKVPGVGSYDNWKIDYQMYDFIPQVPSASLNTVWPISDYSVSNRSQRDVQLLSDDEFVEAEIGFKNIEGTSYIIVEQTDSDYPVPYNFVIEDLSSGCFLTLMNKNYPSIFTLTYVNDNGTTTGEMFEVDLRNEVTTQDLTKKTNASLALKDEMLVYSLVNVEPADTYCLITDLQNGGVILKETCTEKNGCIRLNHIPTGCYAITMFFNNHKIKEIKWNKR